MRFFSDKSPKQDAEVKQPAPVARTPQANPARSRPGNQTRQIKIISKREEIPHHVAILSCSGGPLELPEEWQKNYAILLTNREKKEVEVVCSTEIIKKSVNDDLLTIVDQIRRNGYTRTHKWIAKPEMISIIYESTENQKTREEQERTATKIQIEFDDLVTEALNTDVSDIHIEVRRDEAKVRFRKNGDLFEYNQWPVRYARVMAGVIYQVIADEKDTTFDEMKPQDAIIDRDLGENGRIRIRLATIPAYPSGFDMIMRILKMGVSGKRRTLESLGYNRAQLTNLRRAVARPVGALAMAGTTGSGKSTSLNSMLGEKIEIFGGRVKVITVEDPPEYMLKNATQVPVVRSRSQAKSGDPTANPFAAVVRAAMRSDPDILMVGEVRDQASAELLIHAVQSGHQVFTTIHASSAIDIVARMRSNEVPDDVLGSPSFFSALMYQTLLPVLCQHCSIGISDFAKSVAIEQDFELLQRIFKYLKPADASKLRFKHDEGCPHCVAGVTGRSVASEVLLPDPYMLKCFRERRDADALLHYRHKNGKLSLEHGLSRALHGLFDMRDVEHKLDRITRLDELSHAVQVYKDPDSVNIHVPYSICMTDLIDGDDVEDEAAEARKKESFLADFLLFLEDKPVIESASNQSTVPEQPEIDLSIIIGTESVTVPAMAKVDTQVLLDKAVEVTPTQPPPEQLMPDRNKEVALDNTQMTSALEALGVAAENSVISIDSPIQPPPVDVAVVGALVDEVVAGETETKSGSDPDTQMPVREIAINKKAVVSIIDAPEHTVKRIAELIQTAISDELSRNGLTLSAKFLHARASDASLVSMTKNEALDKSLRDELQELISTPALMAELKDLDGDQLFSLLPKGKAQKEAPAARYKSKLLGGEDEADMAKKRSTAKVQTLDAARNRRKGKPVGNGNKDGSTDATDE
jgi:type II secretory ATPase GspE/PulE/Tfp pilus assembly ATPase PilB-like protein